MSLNKYMEEMDNELFGETANKRNDSSMKDHIKKYLAYWPVFILSMSIFIGGALLYLRKATPKYIANALILVKGKEKYFSGRSDKFGFSCE